MQPLPQTCCAYRLHPHTQRGSVYRSITRSSTTLLGALWMCDGCMWQICLIEDWKRGKSPETELLLSEGVKTAMLTMGWVEDGEFLKLPAGVQLSEEKEGNDIGDRIVTATEVVIARGGRPGSPVLLLARCVFLSPLHIYASPPIISLSSSNPHPGEPYYICLSLHEEERDLEQEESRQRQWSVWTRRDVEREQKE